MKKWFWVCIQAVCVCAVGVAAPLEQAAVERQIQTTRQQSQVAGERRFMYMRYYQPSDRFPAQTSNSTRGKIRALALYLVNMYVSSHVYSTPNPSALTLDYVGVLDGFEQEGKDFNFSRAVNFYKDHQEAVDELVNRYLEERSYPWEKPTLQERIRWTALLQTIAGRSIYAGARTWLNRTLTAEGEKQLESVLKQTQPDLNRKVIVYDEPDLRLEDFDVHIGNHTYRRKRTYRWVKDECYYSSYLLAKQLTQAIVTSPSVWEHTHLYILTAEPTRDEFLTPAQGERFKLADGTYGLHWRYHTAVLVVFQQNGAYYLVILDRFLAGGKPVPLGTWLSHFSSQTQFQAKPFVRSKKVEDALKIPSRTEGNAIWAEGNKYIPASVVR